MKKVWRYFILLVVLSALLCMSVFAAEELPVFTAEDGVAVEATEMQADKFTLTYTKTGLSGECLVLMITQEEAAPASEEPQYTITENTIQYVNQDAAAEGKISFTIYPKEMVNGVILLASQSGIEKLGTVSAPKEPAPAGVTVSGTVTSYLTGDATVELVKGGATVKTAIGAAYEFKEVAAGTYTLKVSKTNHVTREYAITVGETAVTQDVKICPLGDVTVDGIVDIGDHQRMFEHLQGISVITDAYQLLMLDVAKDAVIDIGDHQRLFEHLQGISPLY